VRRRDVMTLRIYVDFNSMLADLEERVDLPTHRQPHLRDILQPGQKIVMFTPYDIEVEGVVEHDADGDHWYGRADWSTVRDLGSEAFQQYRDVAYKIRQWREKHGMDANDDPALIAQAAELWHRMADDERAWLRDDRRNYLLPELQES